MVGHVETDFPIEFEGARGEGSLPSVVVPVELRCRDQVDLRIRHAEVDPLQVDPRGSRISLQGVQDPPHGMREGDRPNLMLARCRQQRPEAHFGFGTPVGLAGESGQKNLHRAA